MAEPGASVMTRRTLSGRVFSATRRVRLADVGPDGCCRLDALARYAQDIARDDSADSGLTEPMNWVVRRTMLEVAMEPVFQESVELITWCSGFGSRWAERRTSVQGELAGRVEVATLWVRVDGRSGRPVKLSDDFFELYGDACAGRQVSARTALPVRPPHDARQRKWELRFCDLDVLGHVNNAAQWATVEEALDFVGLPRRGMRAELEHAGTIDRLDDALIRWVVVDGGMDCWLVAGDKPGHAARVRPID